MDSERIPNLARCPRCFEVIDADSATCRFCNSVLDSMQMKSAAAAFRASVEAKSKINDSRSLRAAIIGLIAIVAFAGYTFFSRMDRGQRLESANNIKRIQKAVHDKDYKLAIAGAQSFVDNDPNNALLHLLLATVLGSSGDSVDAVSELQTARQLDPKNFMPPLLLGITYYDRKIYESADLWLTNAIELDRKSGKPLQYRGLSRFMLDKTEAAMEDFRTAERLDPKTYPVTCSLGMAHIRKRQYGPAVSSLEECVKRSPNNTSYRKYLADAYAAAGRRDDAISTIDRVIQKHPDDENAKKLRAALDSLPEKRPN